jgi:hypothetical protein
MAAMFHSRTDLAKWCVQFVNGNGDALQHTRKSPGAPHNVRRYYFIAPNSIQRLGRPVAKFAQVPSCDGYILLNATAAYLTHCEHQFYDAVIHKAMTHCGIQLGHWQIGIYFARHLVATSCFLGTFISNCWDKFHPNK